MEHLAAFRLSPKYVVQRRPPSAVEASAALLAETVERIAMLRGELVRERDVLVAPACGILVGEDPHIFVESIAKAEMILAHRDQV
jgi:hypothetical protein